MSKGIIFKLYLACHWMLPLCVMQGELIEVKLGGIFFL